MDKEVREHYNGGERTLTFLLVSLCSLREEVCCRKACW